eukprot:CAMPEP_0170136488 /NCGR_PEP_ID=MMETSP0033_2-20121228/3335_1 /TAXON_ID=195969 /ORGANISM="Dolichomastix tenuilepis, Strain CCMP3274" /LENGTH=190 /DNA_ID=CAMNT_0010372215 /DNA_START=60 /DNA_END=629 /DNA_ORIENTATION=-
MSTPEHAGTLSADEVALVLRYRRLRRSRLGSAGAVGTQALRLGGVAARLYSLRRARLGKSFPERLVTTAHGFLLGSVLAHFTAVGRRCVAQLVSTAPLPAPVGGAALLGAALIPAGAIQRAFARILARMARRVVRVPTVRTRLQRLGHRVAKGWVHRKAARHVLDPLARAWSVLERSMPQELRERVIEAE